MAANLDTISTRLNHLNIFLMGSCSNQKKDSYDSLRDAVIHMPEIVEDLYSIDFPGTAVRIPGNWTRLDASLEVQKEQLQYLRQNMYVYKWDRGDFRAPWSCFFSNLLG